MGHMFTLQERYSGEDFRNSMGAQNLYDGLCLSLYLGYATGSEGQLDETDQ